MLRRGWRLYQPGIPKHGCGIAIVLTGPLSTVPGLHACMAKKALHSLLSGRTSLGLPQENALAVHFLLPRGCERSDITSHLHLEQCSAGKMQPR